MVAIFSSNSMASNSIGRPCHSTMLARCRSPWQRRTQPTSARAIEDGRGARELLVRMRARRRRRPGRQTRRSRASALQIEATSSARSARSGDRGDTRSTTMAVEHGIGDGLGQVRVDSSRRSDAAQQRRLVEAAHVHRPFDDLAVAAERERAVGRAGDRHAAEIDLGREPTVDLHLARAGRPALLERGEVHVGKANRALDLPGVLAGEEHQVAVRLQAIDLRHVGVGRRVGQERDDGRLVSVLGDASLIRHGASGPCMAAELRAVAVEPGKQA